MLSGFKKFILRGNVIDLAVAVVIGAAFTMVVNALVDGIINPLVAAVFGETDLSSVGTFTINDARFSLGLVLDALLSFVLVAAALTFAPLGLRPRRRSLRQPANHRWLLRLAASQPGSLTYRPRQAT